MGTEYSLTVAEVAKILGFTKSYIQRLVREGKLDAELQQTPVNYYLIDPASVETFKSTPKNKGGRPRRK